MGYRSPRQTLASALEGLAAYTPKEREGLEGLLATHPSLDERLAALEPLEGPVKPVTPVARARGSR